LNDTPGYRIHEQGFPAYGQKDEHDQDKKGHQPKAFYIAVQEAGKPESDGHSAEKHKQKDQEQGYDDPGEIAGRFGKNTKTLQPVDLHPGLQVLF